MSRGAGRAVLVVASLVLSAGPLAAGEPTCGVAYDADRVTVHAAGVPLADVVREIGRQSGAEIVGEVRKPRDVSQDFERVPLADALVRLLRDQNFTLRYGPEGKLRKIDLLGEPLALAAGQTPRADPSKPDKPIRAHHHRHRHGHSSQETLPDGQVLVTVAGTEGARGSPEGPAQLGEHSAPGAAAAAQSNQENALQPEELDRRLRRRFFNLLTQMDQSTLAQYFATAEGQKTQAFLEDFATHHSFEDSRQKANDILDRARGPASQAPQDHF
jgi:hypothetical protein